MHSINKLAVFNIFSRNAAYISKARHQLQRDKSATEVLQVIYSINKSLSSVHIQLQTRNGLRKPEIRN